MVWIPKDYHLTKMQILREVDFQAQQLTDLEQKLAIAREELEKAALDKESQLKALKETVQLCLSSVLHTQSPIANIIPSRSINRQTSSFINGSKAPLQVTNPKQRIPIGKEIPQVSSKKVDTDKNTTECNSKDIGNACLENQSNVTDPSMQKLHSPPWIKPENNKSTERKGNNAEESAKINEKTL
ncbi:leucine zipper protein 2-like isoform X3 [Crotalus tigris]|uniref:leucine zipper protein 2-like isoform X3 n=1 Tax=Crotalus tigris TaxID=88082 RepID=UPI00192F6D17|nr:leucine zipper protein 2-like isoform X3 [Crotalus tigris]